MANALKKVFRVSKKIENEQWGVHYDKERKRRDAEQADIRRRREAGETVASVHYQTSITTWDHWQAKDSNGQIITWSDYEEEGEEVTSSRRRAHPGSNDNLSE